MRGRNLRSGLFKLGAILHLWTLRLQPLRLDERAVRHIICTGQGVREVLLFLRAPDLVTGLLEILEPRASGQN